MDEFHQQEYNRIFENRKRGGRLLNAPPSSSSATSRNPLGATNESQPISATKKVDDSITSGAIVIEEERPQKSVAAAAPLSTSSTATTTNNNNNNNNTLNKSKPYVVVTDVTSSTVVTKPAPQQQQDPSEIERIKRQNEEQARQIEQLRKSLEQIQKNQNQPQQQQQGTSSFNFVSTSNNNNNNNTIRPPPPSTNNNQQQPNIINAVEENFRQAESMGLFVKPRRIVSDGGKQYITFNSPSQNQRGSLAQTRSSPNRHVSNNNNNNKYADENDQPYFDPQATFHPTLTKRTMTPQPNQKNPASSPPPTTATTTNKKSNSRSLIPFENTRTAPTDRVPRPFSNSTLDTKSAMLLLMQGNFFYKLRVRVKTASVLGPAAWDIESWERRWVYLDDSTYMIKWGDKPKGSATLFSHYVAIDDIVKVDMYNQIDPNYGGDAPRVIYYIVMNVVEGGFNARSRVVQKRLCVIATELRDKADMWYDALQSITGFYKSQRVTTQMDAKTFASD